MFSYVKWSEKSISGIFKSIERRLMGQIGIFEDWERNFSEFDDEKSPFSPGRTTYDLFDTGSEFPRQF